MLTNLWGHLSYFISDFGEFLIILLIITSASFTGIYLLYKSSLNETNKKILISLILFFFSFVWIYSGFEVYFRYKFDQSDSLGFLNVTKRWYARHVVYNNYQFRDNDFRLEKKPGVVRIGVMGDSNAWGYGIKDINNRFSNQLETKLKKAGYNVEVYNFAVPGEDTWNEIEEYNRNAKKFNIDILIWSYFLNDAEPKDSAGTQILINSGKQIPPLIRLISGHSVFFDYLYWRLSTKYNSTFLQLRNVDIQQYSIKPVFEAHKISIENFTKDLNKNNIKTVVLVFPFMRYFPNYPATSIHDKMDKVFKDAGVTVLIDLLPTLHNKQAKDLIINRFDTHPNELVHKIAADKLYNAIIPLLEKTKDKGTIIKTQ